MVHFYLKFNTEAICDSYRQNMLEGRKKLDKLEWGESWVESIGNNEYYVHFTDNLSHKGLDHTHHCKQKIVVRNDKIMLIRHIDNDMEVKKLSAFYRKVGLK